MLESEIQNFEKKKKIEVYKGKPETWNVLDSTVDENSRLRAQREVKDVRVMKQMYDQIDNIIIDKEEIMKKKFKEEIDYPIKTKYEN